MCGIAVHVLSSLRVVAGKPEKAGVSHGQYQHPYSVRQRYILLFMEGPVLCIVYVKFKFGRGGEEKWREENEMYN